MKTPLARFPESRSKKHDHSRCVARALKAAEQVCEERELLLTPIRRRVLELVWSRHAPVGAYAILGSLKKGEGALAPNTVYRALDFLLSAGLIHRIDTLNAYIGCETPREDHAAQFLVCQSCNRVEELGDQSISQLLMKKAKTSGFTVDTQAVEIKGVCADCAKKQH